MKERAIMSVLVLVCWAALLGGCEAGAAEGDEEATEAQVAQVEPFDSALAQNLPANTSADLAQQGRELFGVCATCHGPDGRGTQLGPSLRDQEWISISGSYEDIQAVVRNGVPEPKEFPIPMPRGGAAAFDESQVQAVAAYVYALSRSAGN